MTFLVTGAGGYIGSVAIYYFLSRGMRVIAVDNFSTGFRAFSEFINERFGDQCAWYERDIRKGCGDIFRAHPYIDAVIHFAGKCNINESIANPLLYYAENIGGTVALLDDMKASGVRHIVFSSTAAVYGEAQYFPVDENHPCVPLSPYAETKRVIENILENCANSAELSYAVLRFFNVCGASDDGLVGCSKFPPSLLFQNVVRGALGIAPFFLTCSTVDTSDGTTIRDYVDVVDLAHATVRAAEFLLRGGRSSVVNIGTGTGYSVKEIICAVEEISGATIPFKKTESRSGECSKIVASNTLALDLFGWKPQRTLQESIASTIQWHTFHPDGWDA